MEKNHLHVPSFFRVLLNDFSKGLAIPRAFVKHIIKERSNRKAMLMNPNGGSWTVNIHKDDEKAMHFGGDGWQQLIHAHKLGLGYFMVFSYKGKMVFEFRAYDLSTCEMSYPWTARKTKKRVIVVIDESSDEGDNNAIPPKRWKGEEIHPPSECMEIQFEGTTSQMKITNTKIFQNHESKKTNNSSSPERRKCVEARSLNITRKCRGRPPKNRKCKEIDISIKRKCRRPPKNRECKEIDPSNKRRCTEIRPLVKKNCKEIDPSNKRRCTEIRPLVKKNCKEMDTPLERKCKEVQFERNISAYNLAKQYMYIPVAVVKKWNAVRRTKNLTLNDPKGRLWPVKLFHRKTGIPSGSGIHIANGWQEFACGNELKVGDVCVFQLGYEGGLKVLNVQIVRHS